MIDLCIETNLFGPETLSFSIPENDPRCSLLVADYKLEYSYGSYFITKVEDEIDEEGYAYKAITAEAGWMRLADRKKPGTVTITGTAARGLFLILEGSGWTTHWLTDDPTEYTMEMTDSNVLEMIWQWAKQTGTEPSFNSLEHRVSLFEGGLGEDRGYSFRYGKNVRQIKRTVLPPKATRLYAYGKNDLDISSMAGGKQYVEDYSWYTANGMTLPDAQADYRKDEEIVDDTFTDASALYAMAVRTLTAWAQPTITYEAKVVDLSTLVGYDEATFITGDTVWVEGEPISVSERARVTRIKRFPYEPSRDELELTFGNVVIPDAKQSSGRSDTTQSWELFTSRNVDTPRFVWQGSQIINRIKLHTVEGAEWVVGYTLKGTAVGASTVTLEFIDTETGLPWWTTKTFALTDGQAVDYSISWGKKEIPSGDSTLAVRMYSNSLTNGMNIAADRSNLWVLARGTTRENPTLANSVRFDFTGGVQHWTAPDDVSEYQIESHGAGPNGRGAMIRAMHALIPGSEWDIYIGGAPGTDGTAPLLLGGWPNGGASDGPFSSQQGGGGSTDIRPAGTTYASAIQLAGAGGGRGEPSASNPSAVGGDGGFFSGTASQHGNPGTQSGGGAGGSSGTDGTANQGGRAIWGGNFFDFGGGGGGGGWFGGEGGQAAGSPSQSGGAGGSSHISTDCWDVETLDGENTGHGYMIISWETPEA